MARESAQVHMYLWLQTCPTASLYGNRLPVAAIGFFSGKNGRWCVGGQDVRESNFITAAGWLYQTHRHNGRMPQDVGGPWQRWDGSAYQEDDAIRVAVATPSMLQPSRCSRGTTLKQNCLESFQPSVPQPPTLVSRVKSRFSHSSKGSRKCLEPPPPRHTPPCAPASPPPTAAQAEGGLLDLRGIRMGDRHRRMLEAAPVGGQLRVCI